MARGSLRHVRQRGSLVLRLRSVAPVSFSFWMQCCCATGRALGLQAVALQPSSGSRLPSSHSSSVQRLEVTVAADLVVTQFASQASPRRCAPRRRSPRRRVRHAVAALEQAVDVAAVDPRRVLPSSHSSPGSTRSLPQISSRQSAEQPSLGDGVAVVALLAGLDLLLPHTTSQVTVAVQISWPVPEPRTQATRFPSRATSSSSTLLLGFTCVDSQPSNIQTSFVAVVLHPGDGRRRRGPGRPGARSRGGRRS